MNYKKTKLRDDNYKPGCEYFTEANDPPTCFDPVSEVLFFNEENNNHTRK